MDDLQRRSLLYGSGAVALAGLVWAGFLYRAEPEPGTLLSSANVQLRLAAGMPERDAQGQPVPAREQLIAGAATDLRRCRAQVGDLAVLVEFEGFLLGLQGDPRGAAERYRHARTLPDCLRDQRDTLVFNEARMHVEAGDDAAALEVLRREGASLQPQYSDQRSIEEASVLRSLGRAEEAAGLLARVVAESDEPMAWLQAGEQFARLGRRDAAEAALARAAAAIPIADYLRARLKLEAGAVDTSWELLERAAAAAPAEVRRRLREDAEVWRVVEADERFQRLAAPSQAAPGR